MSRFRRRLLLMMQKVQEIWRDIVMTGTGIIVATDTTEGQQVKIFPQGWTKQDQYEGKNLFDISKFVDGSSSFNNGDGSITITKYAVNLVNKITDVLPNVKVGDVLYISAVNGTLVYIGGKVIDVNNNKSIEITEGVLQNNIFGFYGSQNDGEITISDIIISKEYGAPYEPYTGGQPSPSPEYPQPINNSGKYNEETGKYEYTITVSDAEENPTNTQTVTLTSDRPLTQWDRLVYMDGKWQWEYNSNLQYKNVTDGNVSGNNINSLTGRYYIDSITAYKGAECICNIVPYRSIQKENACGFWYNSSLCLFLSSNYTGNDGTETYQEALQNFKDNVLSKGITIQYKTDTPEYIPLQESEQQALNALKTYYPTTVFSNNQEGFMQVEYRTKYGGDA